jgi:DNA-binding NtrC family response regulator
LAHILIVDDSEEDRLLARTNLGNAGHKLSFAMDGEVALRIYRECDIDVVITDLQMPKLNGFRLVQELRKIDSGVAVVAISGAPAEQLVMAEDFGAVCTLFKPIDPGRLNEAVTQALIADAKTGGAVNSDSPATMGPISLA